jgi:DNA polymerase V
LPEATADTRVLTQWAIRILRRIYRPGFGYHKAGVMLLTWCQRQNVSWPCSIVRAGLEMHGPEN